MNPLDYNSPNAMNALSTKQYGLKLKRTTSPTALSLPRAWQTSYDTKHTLMQLLAPSITHGN